MNEIFYNLDEMSEFNDLNFDIEAHADYIANPKFYENLDDIISEHEYDIYWNDKTLIFQFKNEKYVVDCVNLVKTVMVLKVIIFSHTI